MKEKKYEKKCKMQYFFGATFSFAGTIQQSFYRNPYLLQHMGKSVISFDVQQWMKMKSIRKTFQFIFGKFKKFWEQEVFYPDAFSLIASQPRS